MSSEVRDDYLESLEELTVNSRPVIKTLTEIAQENVGDASAVVEAIETHTLRCPPNQKLPAMYLIDSICKNRGEPYTSLFTPKIVGIFTNAFTVSPEPVRLKLNELFKTWTIPVPLTGQPVFPHEILRQLNTFLATQQPSANPPIPGFMPGPMPGPMPGHFTPGTLPPPQPPHSQGRQRLNQSALMVEMNRFRQLLEKDNKDSFNERQLSLLARLAAQTSGVVDPKDLPQIQNDLEEMKAAREQYLSRPHSAYSSRRGNSNGNSSNGSMRRDGRRNRDTASGGSGGATTGADKRTNGGVDKITGTNNVPLGTRKKRAPKASPPEVEAMAQAVLNNALSSAATATATATTTTTTPQPEKAPSNDSLDLATACEQPASSPLIDQLYSKGLPLQCSTCGYRFRNTEEGREAKQAEMDWHFRANKDMREGHSRNRSWFLVVSAWIAYRDEDEVFGLGSALSTGADIMNNVANGSGGSDNSAPVDLAKEKEKYTEVPLESNVVCPICQEPHETSWSEEAENWVWMNAVEVDGHYFHATCYADPQNKQLVDSVLDRKP